ncbi:MAG: hypothetical protein ACUZ8N_15155 [Candidatus Scalindua sp.]
MSELYFINARVVCQVCYLRRLLEYHNKVSYYFYRWFILASPTRLSGGQPELKRLGSINMIEPARNKINKEPENN